MTEKQNAKRMPQKFYCRHMLPGIVRYENEDILVELDCIKKMLPSMVGVPVYVGHQPVNMESIQEEMDGVVSGAFYNELDGWAWAEMMIFSDKGHDAVNRGEMVSNAYIPTEWDGNGVHLNVDYKRNIRNADFTHLAIVPNPRYEKAKIYTAEQFKAYQSERRNERDQQLINSKETKKEFSMFKMFKSEKTEITNASEVTDESIVEIDGKEFTYGAVKAALENAKTKKNEAEDEFENVSDDTEVHVGEMKMSAGEFVEKYNKRTKKNSEEEERKNAEDEERKNAEAEEEKKKKEEEEKTNALKKKEQEDAIAAFKELQNAGTKKEAPSVIVETGADRLQRGKERY